MNIFFAFKKLTFFLFFSIIILTIGCSGNQNISPDPNFFRDEMRKLVIEISNYSKAIKSDFSIITQNGNDLFSEYPKSEYLGKYFEAVDGVGQESLWIGNPKLNKESPEKEIKYVLPILQNIRQEGLMVFVTDYCSSMEMINKSIQKNSTNNFVSFQANKRELDDIPRNDLFPLNINNNIVKSLTNVKNFLYFINPGNKGYKTRDQFLKAISLTNYDMFIIDAFFWDDILLKSDLEKLKQKPNGGGRLIIAYLSIGEAEDYRYYWKPEWSMNPPSWLGDENPDWKGNFRVQYWTTEWQSLIYGTEDSYINKIIDAGFDGVYLDTIDTFWYFEEKTQN